MSRKEKATFDPNAAFLIHYQELAEQLGRWHKIISQLEDAAPQLPDELRDAIPWDLLDEAKRKGIDLFNNFQLAGEMVHLELQPDGSGVLRRMGSKDINLTSNERWYCERLFREAPSRFEPRATLKSMGIDAQDKGWRTLRPKLGDLVDSEPGRPAKGSMESDAGFRLTTFVYITRR